MPQILLISSHVVRGRIGLRGASFAIERLGVPCWVLPTVTLPWHPGHGPASRVVPDAQSFQTLIDDLKGAPWRSELGAVITGYLGSVEQAASIRDFIVSLKAENPELIYCCDPVIGDEGGLYVPEGTAAAIRDTLVPLADMVTPNRFEFDWLTGKTHFTNEDILETAKSINASKVAVTSAFPIMKQSTATLLWDDASETGLLAEHRAFENAPNGPGDLFTALFTARVLLGAKPAKALETATAGVFEMLAQTVKKEMDELVLVEEQTRLERPMAMVNMRRLTGNVVKKKGVVVTPKPL